jgi:hypothetical protein
MCLTASIRTTYRLVIELIPVKVASLSRKIQNLGRNHEMTLISSADKNSKHKTFHADEIEKPETTSPKKETVDQSGSSFTKIHQTFSSAPLSSFIHHIQTHPLLLVT